MPTINLMSTADHMALAGIYKYLPLPPILYFLLLWQTPQQVLPLFLKECPIPTFLKGLL